MPIKSSLVWLGAGALLCCAVSAPAARARGPRDEGTPSTERNKALARRWIEEGFNRRDFALVDELFAERFAVNGQVVGRAGLKASMGRHVAAFPDLHVTIEEMLAEGSKVGVWYRVDGTHQGEFESIPATGKAVSWVGFDLFTIENGRIADARFLSDLLGLLRQIGATVSPPRREP
jgi:steroid delta-isomerase-like uncharacterized protein